ncbi:L-beta-phenylalanine forming phenylalanine aminomutase [Colletotrichum liriopes]|uniref:L-beta-phenylalanine forming phenylalanine aminomutase n=1 Tax=Colletotrichum liriopes TaxID=708192 RepID=A0AA37GI06_9PEZI|nr:L-beta-phenylalanine forming phenylalanine aminomutase [Colletotrichum liriopes]
MTVPPGLESSHASVLLGELNKLRGLQYSDANLALDGDSLDVASVVAVARHGLTPHVKDDPEIKRKVVRSIQVLDHHIENGWVVYGVNTGFGGSADSRTEQLKKLQISLLQHTQSAVITSTDLAQDQVDQDGQSHVIPQLG